MAEQNQDQDKTEQATPFKLKEAKKKGTVSKSMEFNSLLILTAGWLFMLMLGEKLITQELWLSHQVLGQSHAIEFNPVNSILFFENIVTGLGYILWPLVLCLMVLGILATMVQTGPVFSFFPLKPDMNRINPVQGFKRLFSKRLMFETLKSFIKILLFAWVVYLVIKDAIPVLLAALDSEPGMYPRLLLSQVTGLLGKLLLVLFFIALIDMAFTRWEFGQKMRMSRRELKEEIKRRDGDPHIKARQRELQREAAKRSGALGAVPDADVLITNPTHLSIALQYRRDEMHAPKVIAKGAGEMAMKMREVARKHRIPLVENKKLARALFRETAVDTTIAATHFPVVARILVKAMAKKRQLQAARFNNAKETGRSGRGIQA